MADFKYTDLSKPHLEIGDDGYYHRILFHALGKLYILSDGTLYVYNEVKDSWSVEYNDNELGVNVDGFYKEKYYFVDGKGHAICHDGILYLFGRRIYDSGRVETIIQRFNMSTHKVSSSEIFEVHHDGYYDSYSFDISSGHGLNDSAICFNNYNGRYSDIIYLDDIQYSSLENAYYIEYDNIIRTPKAFDVADYIFYNSEFDYGGYGHVFEFFTDEYAVINSRGEIIKGGFPYIDGEAPSIVQVVMDGGGFIVILKYLLKYRIARLNVDTSVGVNIQFEDLGSLDIFYTGLSDQNLGIVFNKSLYFMPCEIRDTVYVYGHFGIIELGNEKEIVLNHLGKIWRIGLYDSGEFPVNHMGRIGYLKSCSDGDIDQSPLVIKHNGKIYYIST